VGQALLDGVAHLLDPAIFVTLLALLVVSSIPYGAVHPWWEAVFECTVFALAALWIIDGLHSGTWSVSEHRVLLPLLPLIGFALIQSLKLWGVTTGSAQALSADPYETWRVALKLVALTLAAAFLIRYTSSPSRLRLLIYTIIGIGVASALFGIARQVGQGEAYISFLPRLWPGRGYGQFINQNHFAFLMEMGLGLVLGVLVGGGVPRDRLLIFLAAGVAMGAALVLSNSRGGIFSMFCELLFLAIMFGVVRSQREISMHHSRVYLRLQAFSNSVIGRGLLIVCLLTVVVVSIAWLGGDQLSQRMETMERDFSTGSSEVRTNVTRWDMWSATWKSIKDHPIVGVGFGAYPVAIAKYHDGSGDLRPRQAHNDYLDLLACGGVLGLLLVAWFITGFIKQLPGRLRSSDRFRRSACLGALVGLFGVAVHSLVDFGLHITANALIFTSLVVIATVNGCVGEKGFSNTSVNRYDL
jgi:O-antigen ligase